jgi:hypothetical protein
MKKRFTILICIVVLLVTGVTGLSATEQVRLVLNLAADFVENPTLASVQSSFDDQAKVFWGPSWEVILDNVGFGMHYLVKFDRLSTGLENPLYDWSLDWMGDFFVSYHFFGVGRFLDPFIEVGFGNAGRVDIDRNYGYWDEDSHGEWDYVYEWRPNQGGVSNMSLFPYIGAGLAVDLNGVILGGRVDYRPIVLPVPATQFADYPLTNLQVGFFAGFALGGH